MRDVYVPDLLHALFPLFLLLEQFSFSAYVSAVALRRHVFSHCTDGFAGDDLSTDCGLQCDLEELSGEYILKLGAKRPAPRFRLVAVHDRGKGIDWLGIDEDFHAHE